MLNIKKEKGFIFLFLITMVLSIVLNSLLAYSIKNEITSELKSIIFSIESSSDFDGSLYYRFEDGFKSHQQIKNTSLNKKRLEFLIPNSEKLITNYRLDFGNAKMSNRIKILSISYNFDKFQREIKGKEVFETFFLNSESASLDFKNQEISINTKANVFDPYIVFKPIAQTQLKYHPLRILPLLLFFFFFLFFFCKSGIKFKDIKVQEYFMLLFIVCIPLKIAWSTFATIILTTLAIWKYYKTRKLGENRIQGFFLIAIFLALAILGRVNDIQKIDHQLGLVLFGFIGIILSWRKIILQRFFVFFFLFLNGIVVVSGISFLFFFPTFYGLDVSEYFLEIKTYNGNIRDWLYYNHATFISFFGLVGLLFLHRLRFFSKKDLAIKVLYHILLVSLIMLFGVRICLLLYFIFLINILLKLEIRRRILVNSLLFTFTITSLLFFVNRIDNNREMLWAVSIEAIKEKPFFGHGLGSSDEVLHLMKYRKNTNSFIPLALNHSHNQFFTFLMELGFLGSFILFLFCFIFLFRTKLFQEITIVLFIFGLCYVFLTESILQTSKPLYVICFMFLLMQEKFNKLKAHIT